jgi:L-alanine-DL-glutamate epimerase-like enolase superfamily enzyme
MKIKNVELSILRTEVGQEVIPTKGAIDKMPQLVLVTVSTHEGIDGHYVSYLIPSTLVPHAAEVAKAILIGRDTYDVGALNREMTTALPPYSNPPALAGADACLWDINAKAANLPLYQYLGAYRHEIRAYASTMAYSTVDGYIDAIRGAVAEGFTAAKVHPFRDPAKDIELAQALRHEFPHIDLMIDPVCAYIVPEALAVGKALDELDFYWYENPISDLDLMIDPVCAYTVPEALAVGKALDELDFYWYENPISDLDLEGLSYLRSKLSVPLAIGEQNFAGFAAIHEYLHRGSGFFFIRTLAEYGEGVTQLLKSAHACEAFNTNYEIHSYGPTLNLAMYLNVALAIPNCDFAEIMVPQNVLSMGMATADLPEVDDRGYLAGPQKPGLGYEIDPDAVENLTLQRF